MRLDVVGEFHLAYLDGKLVAQVSDWVDLSKDKPLDVYGKAGVWATGGSADFSRIAIATYDPPEDGSGQ